MNFEYSNQSLKLQNKLDDFMQKHIFPNEKEILEFRLDNPWKHSPKLEVLKNLAKNEGLWNLFLPKGYGKLSPGLTNLEYAPLAELMGRCSFSSEIFEAKDFTYSIVYSVSMEIHFSPHSDITKCVSMFNFFNVSSILIP